MGQLDPLKLPCVFGYIYATADPLGAAALVWNDQAQGLKDAIAKFSTAPFELLAWGYVNAADEPPPYFAIKNGITPIIQDAVNLGVVLGYVYAASPAEPNGKLDWTGAGVNLQTIAGDYSNDPYQLLDYGFYCASDGAPPPLGGNPPPPPPPPPPPGGGDDTVEDEIEVLIQLVQDGFNAILLQLKTCCAGGQGFDAACCTALVSSIGLVANAIASINPSVTVAVDLKPVVAELAAVVKAIAALPAVDTAPIAAAIASLNLSLEAINTTLATGTDTAGIIEKLKELNETDIAGKELLDQLVALGVLDPVVGQILGDPVRVRIDPGRYAPETIKILKHLHDVTPEEANRILAYIKDLIARLFDWANKELGNLITGDNTPATTILSKLEPALLGMVTNASSWVDAVPRSVMQLTEKVIENGGPVTPDNAEERGFRAFGFAFLVGQGIHILADLAKFLGYPMSSLWSSNAALLVELLAYDDIRKNLHGPYWETVIGANRRYQVHRQFRPFVPGLGPALSLYARRVIDEPTADTLLSYAGEQPGYAPAIKRGAYTGIQPRVFAQLFVDQPFDRDFVQNALEFHGMRPDDIPHLLDAYELATVKNVRQQYVSAIVRSAELGTLNAADLESSLTDLGFSAEAKHWVKLTVATRKLDQLAELYRKSISEAYQFGQITDAQYVPALEAIGIASPDANAHFAVDSIKLRGHQAAAAAREAAKLAAATTRAASSAAIENFQRGNIDAVGLGLALAAAGVAPLVVPFVVDTQELKRESRKRIVFGLERGPAAATLLREQIEALKEQVLNKAITIGAAILQLKGFSLPEPNIDALAAAWNAQVNKTALPITG